MSNSSLGNWHRRGTGHYVRKRGEIYDAVRKIQRGHRGSAWVVYINGEGGKKLFKTRLEATAALDSYLRHQAKPKAEIPAKSEIPMPDEARKREDCTCDKCNGSGVWYGRGYVENGVFKGFSGKCFGCQGKGWQDSADRKRNWGYNNFHRRIEA